MHEIVNVRSRAPSLHTTHTLCFDIENALYYLLDSIHTTINILNFGCSSISKYTANPCLIFELICKIGILIHGV